MAVAPRAYLLCEKCLRRQGEGTGGMRMVRGPECFICGGLLDTVPSVAKKAAKVARRYQFRSFSVGISLPPGIQEREDELRSDLKLKGNETVKTQAAKIVGEVVSSILSKKVDKFKPDLTLVADLGKGEVSTSSRPLFFHGRYSKPSGVSQRRELCPHCSGAGCQRCRDSGFRRTPSVEEGLRKRIATFTGSEKMTFTWLGSEDRSSRVYAPGRPFVAEVKNPVKRNVPRSFVARVKGGRVAVTSGRVLPSKPLRLPAFRFRTEIHGLAARKVGEEVLAEIGKRFRNAEVRFDRPHDRPTMKRVYKASADARGRIIVIDAELDGGLPVKRFVSGELVSPSVSEVLKTEVRCRTFDICQVRETGRFEFAEVARSQKKN